VPADATGAEHDLIKFSDRVILYEGADKKHDWLHTGGMVQIGLTWRLLDAPGSEGGTDGGTTPGSPDPAKDLIEKLTELDKNPPPVNAMQGYNAQQATYYKQRTALLEQILAKSTGDKETWARQIADNYSTLAQCGSKEDKAAAKQRLAQFLAESARTLKADSPLLGYITFRELWGRFGESITMPSSEKDMVEAQEKWLDALSKFVQQFPKAEDVPDALMQLGTGREFSKEDEAKRWYQQLVKDFPEHALTAKARGCIRRLELVGQPFELAAPTLAGSPYNITSARGKVVVVYYWNKDCGACVGDFARLKQLHTSNAAKGLEVVGVSLDDRIEDARTFLQANALPVTHLFQSAGSATGLSGPLAMQYGIMTMPQIILVGKDGNVISRTVQINDLEDAIKKALQP
jgi:peroxiredoxin